MKIVDAFDLTDGLILLLGSPDEPVTLPCKAELVIDGESVGLVEVSCQRMGGPGLPQGQCVFELGSPLPVPIEVLRSAQEAGLNFLPK